MIDLLTSATDLVAAAPLPADLLPNPEPALPPGFSDPVSTLFSWIKGIAFAVCGAGLIVAAIMIGIGHRRGEGPRDALGAMMGPLAGAIIAGAAIGLVGTLAGV